ncbi:uncharacterized protein LOC122807687 [Protopterus annectens]|uniref:uncharacterized protein LOC122807687 n=1 Tax=Protopterus annectens TaxID=7888 RepID=UPI001CFB6076|nr:uncharacterized protein LOC122807687 [Protopterus annectens]
MLDSSERTDRIVATLGAIGHVGRDGSCGPLGQWRGLYMNCSSAISAHKYGVPPTRRTSIRCKGATRTLLPVLPPLTGTHEECITTSSYWCSKREVKPPVSHVLFPKIKLSSPYNTVSNVRKHRNQHLLQNRFRQIAKCAAILRLLYRDHHLLGNHDYTIERVKRWTVKPQSLEPEQDILFDLSLFKAKQQVRIPESVKWILHQKPEERSEQDTHFVLTALQPVKSFGEYSTKCQTRLAKVSWYVSCVAQQVLILQGYDPLFFYICLSGYATMIRRDSSSGQVKPIWFISRGDAFGEKEIINGECWEASVIVQEPAEFLCINKEDFIKIFQFGSRKTLMDPENTKFLRSLHFLNGWPMYLLESNPEKCCINHYRRGTVILKNTTTSDWIYVVISGSCSIMKLFQEDRQMTSTTTAKRRKQDICGKSKSGHSIPNDHSRKRKANPVCITVDTLVKGCVFGLSDCLFEEQPSLCVISNGVECFQILKKFYLNNISADFLEKLKYQVFPYPNEKELSNRLQQELEWQIFRKRTMDQTMQTIKVKQTIAPDFK